MNGVQRFLHGGNNRLRFATSFTGPVRPIANAVIQKPVARSGSLVGAVSGTFTGAEEALYEFQVVNTIADTPIVTAPIFLGVGNGAMQSVAAAGLSVRTVDVTLADLGQLLTAASADLQGVRVMMDTPGAAGNAFYLQVDRSGLVFTPQTFSLLEDLAQGESSVIGPQYDWQTVAANANGSVPPTAKRLIFGEDRNNIYVQYKKLEDGEVTYHFEPPIKQKYAAKTRVSFVTGTYTAKLYEIVAGTPTLRETYAGITTLYDLLNSIRSTSAFLLVQGAVANDRNSGGQALLELTLNTDARIVLNTGEGSEYATGFIDTSISANSPTELVEATCIAATSLEAPGATLGGELWELKGSVSGVLRNNLKTGDLFSNAFFAARIPQKLPPGYIALPKGSFTVKEINYNEQLRTLDEVTGEYTPLKPPICVDSRTLGVNAQDAVITLTYKKRPAVNACSCSEDRGIALSPFCLGVVTDSEGGNQMPYGSGTITRLVGLYDWFADTVRDNSHYFVQTPTSTSGHSIVRQDPFISQPGPSTLQQDPTLTAEAALRANTAYISLFEMVKQFEQTLAEVDKLTAGALRTAAESAWDAALTELQLDVTTYLSRKPWSPPADPEIVPAFENLAAGDAVGVFYDGNTLKARKATVNDFRIGFVDAGVTAGVNASVKFSGVNPTLVDEAAVAGDTGPLPVEYWKHYPSTATPGKYVLHKGGTGGSVSFLTHGQLKYRSATAGEMVDHGAPKNNADVVGMALLPDRYKSRLQHVLISGGISPLGKGDADTGSGDGCWRDNGDDFFWEVVVGEQAYAPAFTGVPYYSSQKYPGGVVVNGVTTPSEGYYSTKEFGFILDIPCKDELVPGDEVILVIGNAGYEPTYRKGDRLILGLVAAQNVSFFGGNDGDNVQTWHVQDSVFGARPAYLLDTDLPVAYSSGGLSFLITQGPIAYVKGDKYSFAIEGGNFQWRKTVGGVVGSWSGNLDIVLTPIALDSGLSLQWTLGAAPAVVQGDMYKFLALQPYALSNLIKPDFDRWEWGGAGSAVLVIDLGFTSTIEALAVAFHTLPVGAAVTVEGGTTPGVYTQTAGLVWRKDVMVKLLATPWNVRYLRLNIPNPNGGIGWFYAGMAVSMTYSAQVQLQREYKVKRSDGINPNGVHQGTSLSGTVTFPEGHVKDADYLKLVDMLDWLKSNDDEALIFLPQATREDEVILATVESDEITFSDVFNFQPNTGVERRISCTIPLRGVAFKG